MKKIFIIPLLLFVAACATVPNPFSTKNIYQTKLVYAATETAADKWRSYCWARPYAVLVSDPVAKPICSNRRPVARAIAKASRYAGDAIAKAQSFIAANPTLDASSLISAADQAVAAFSNVTPPSPVP